MIVNEQLSDFNNDKRKKKRFLVILFWIVFLIPTGFGIAKLLPGCSAPTISYKVKLANDYEGGLTLSSDKANPENNYSANISLNRSIIKDKIMPDALSASDVLCKNEPITYTYNVNADKFSAHISIPKENIKGDISINVSLVDPTDTFPIVLKANGGKFGDGSTTKIFEVISGYALNDLVGYTRPNNFREGYHFTHWELESNRDIKLYEDDVIPYAPEGATYVANCELNEIIMHIYPNGGAFPGMQIDQVLDLNTVYDATINQISDYPGEPTKEGHKFLYYLDTGNNKFYPTSTVTIPNELDDNFLLRAEYAENLNITLDANGGTFPEGASTAFDTYRGITLSELEGYMEPTKGEQGFTYWSYNGSNYYGNDILDLSGNITLTANYATCEHEITAYTIVNNQLYGICSKCGAQLPIPDSELSEFSNQFLYFNGTSYVQHPISDLSTIVSSAETHEKLDIYLINGAYDLDCSRPSLETLVTVKMHGVLNSENQLNASVNCSNLAPGYPRFYLNVDFVFNNLIMNGADSGYLYEVGLKAHNITYNNCYFTSMQSLHSEQVIFNDCYFDATTHPGEPEYSIYSYATNNVEFNCCEFLSIGKAVKIYSEGAAPGAVFKFAECHFYIKEGTPSEYIRKAAIEVNSYFQEGSPYNIYITNCTQTGYYDYKTEDHNGLYHDDASFANFIVTNE